MSVMTWPTRRRALSTTSGDAACTVDAQSNVATRSFQCMRYLICVALRSISSAAEITFELTS